MRGSNRIASFISSVSPRRHLKADLPSSQFGIKMARKRAVTAIQARPRRLRGGGASSAGLARHAVSPISPR